MQSHFRALEIYNLVLFQHSGKNSNPDPILLRKNFPDSSRLQSKILMLYITTWHWLSVSVTLSTQTWYDCKSIPNVFIHTILLQEFDGMMFSFGISEFDSFKHLMIHFANQPILCSNSGTMGYNFELGTLVTLKYPYPKLVVEPEEWVTFEALSWISRTQKPLFSFHEIRMHSTMSIDADVAVLADRMRATPLATKAGFLTKQVCGSQL